MQRVASPVDDPAAAVGAPAALRSPATARGGCRRPLLRLLQGLAAAAWLAAAGTAPAQDFAREARWRAEVVPQLMVGEAIDLPAPAGPPFLGLYVAGTEPSRPAFLIVHGIGVHPDHGLVGRLRMLLADRGHATLSIQMPVLAATAPAEAYEPLMPLAVERIAGAAAWLRSRGHARWILVSHSLGARMAGTYLDLQPAAARAWVAIGLAGGFSRGVGARVTVPVLDAWGEFDLPAVVAAAPQRQAVIAAVPGSRSLRVAGADHFFTGQEARLAEEIAAFAAGLH